jgi:Flp pilus assembly protein TadG
MILACQRLLNSGVKLTCALPIRLALDRRGTTTLEFALIGGLLVPLLLGGMDIGRYMLTQQAVRAAAAEAARMVTVRGNLNLNAGSPACNTLSGALSGVSARVPFLKAASLVVTMSGCATGSNGITTVTVAVSYPFSFQISYFAAKSRQFSETTQALF